MTETIAGNWPIVATIAALYALGAWITWRALALGDDPAERMAIAEIVLRAAGVALWPVICVLWTAVHLVAAIVKVGA